MSIDEILALEDRNLKQKEDCQLTLKRRKIKERDINLASSCASVYNSLVITPLIISLIAEKED